MYIALPAAVRGAVFVGWVMSRKCRTHLKWPWSWTAALTLILTCFSIHIVDHRREATDPVGGVYGADGRRMIVDGRKVRGVARYKRFPWRAEDGVDGLSDDV